MASFSSCPRVESGSGVVGRVSHVAGLEDRELSRDSPTNSLALPFPAACNNAINPQLFPIVCLNHVTSSPSPFPSYSWTPSSSSLRYFSYTSLTGKTNSKADAGRGTNANKEGSEREKTSCRERVGERPRWWRRVVITWGLFSRGTNILRLVSVGGEVEVAGALVVAGVVSAMIADLVWMVESLAM